MKPSTNTRVQLGFLAISCVVVAVLAHDVLVSRDVAVENDVVVRNELREVATLDAKLDGDILEARDGLRANYDEVVDTANALLAAVRALDDGRLGGMRATNAKLDQSLKTLDDQLQNKMRLLDSIKFRHAVVMNSSRFFPQALADVTSPNPSIARARADLERGVMTFRLTSGENQEALEALVTNLKHDSPGLKNDALQIAVRHAEKIATVSSSLDLDTHELLAVPSASTIGVLTAEYNHERSILEERAHRVRNALAALSLALLASFAFVLRQISRLNVSAQRFVPTELLRALGRKALADVKRGDAAMAEMHILFADIRRFSERIENTAPAQAFAFMNEYLTAIGAPIAKHHGFITEYRGDGIFALFPGKADDAVHAALGMLQALAKLNVGRANPVEIGVGVHSGHVLLGTFGATERLNAGVISAAVVMAARLEGLTKQYKAPLLISEATQVRLQPQQFQLRKVDEVLVVGSTQPTFIYDVPVTNGNTALTDLLAIYEKAMKLYRERHFEDAREKFEQLAGDPVSASLAKRCARYLVTPPPAPWKGIFEANEK